MGSDWQHSGIRGMLSDIFASVTRTGISDKGAAALRTGWRTSEEHMKYTDLSNNKMTNAGAESLCSCLEYHKKWIGEES